MGTKLLIVDDEPYTVEMLETFLQINGYDTVGALNGEDGLLMVKVEKPEIVILDLMLPDIEGYEVCQRIRSYPPTSSLPVLMLSARAEPDSKAKALAVGADAYMVKPVQFSMLLSELTRLIGTKQPAPAPDGAVDAQSKADNSPVAPLPITPEHNATNNANPGDTDPKGDTKPLTPPKTTPDTKPLKEPPPAPGTDLDDTKPKRPNNKPE